MSFAIKTCKKYSLFNSILLALCLCCLPIRSIAQDQADEKPKRLFEGLSLGINTGVQSIFSEVYINDVLVSLQRPRWVGELLIAHRWQFIDERIVFGLEVQAGITNGTLQQTFQESQHILINFENNSQIGLGYNAGVVIGKKRSLLLHAYLYQIRRTFHISSTNGINTFDLSKASQTALRYGIGAEKNFAHKLNVKLSVGTSAGDNHSDFSIRPALEFMAGIIYQF